MDASSIIIVCTVVIFINAIGAMRTKKLDEFITVLMTREHKHNHGKMHCMNMYHLCTLATPDGRRNEHRVSNLSRKCLFWHTVHYLIIISQLVIK